MRLRRVTILAFGLFACVQPPFQASEVCYGSRIVSFVPGAGTDDTSADNSLGPPDGPWTTLGSEGVLIIEMPFIFVDEGGDDFTVYEHTGIQENFAVEVSSDNATYASVGSCVGGTCHFDLGSSGLTSARYIRIIDLLPDEGVFPYIGVDIDAVSASTCCPDNDLDGFTVCQGDCDDTNADTYPGAPQVCDGVNNDCGHPGWPQIQNTNEFDDDTDGVTECDDPADCDDSDLNRSPGNPEICDGQDNDCDPHVDLADGDALLLVDTDADGLTDCEELYLVNGVLDIRALGADRLVPDIFVEVDYMSCDVDGDTLPDPEGDCVEVHGDHEVRSETLSAIEYAFAKDRNSDGRPDFALHFVVSEKVPHETMIDDLNELETLVFGADMFVGSVPDPAVICDPANTARFADPGDRANQATCISVVTAKSWVFRHLLVGHDFPGVRAGVAQGGCSASFAFSVYTGGLETFASIVFERWRDVLPVSIDKEIVEALEGAIMHELGHTLGLDHGGGDGVNCKPNYLSVMNNARVFNTAGFGWYLPGVANGLPVRIDRELDYSPLLPALDEETLIEANGLSGPTGLRAAYWNGTILPEVNNTLIASTDGPVDWNFDDTIDGSPYSQNITRITEVGCIDLQEEVLTGHDDWARVAQCIALPRGGQFAASAGTIDFSVPSDEPTLVNYADGSIGSSDFDSDTISNSDDVCPLEFDPMQENSDSDDRGDACDCLPVDSSSWALPSEALELRFDSVATMSWSDPAFTGSESVGYDTVRSLDATDFTSAACVETNDGTDNEAMDTNLPWMGEVFYYLVRARNPCPSGVGPLGASSAGTPRNGISCS